MRILIAEDEAIIAHDIRDIIARFSHTVVGVVDTVEDVFDIVGDRATFLTPALKDLADLVLPESAGAGICGLIRNLIAGWIGDRVVRPERQLSLGWRADQTPFRLDIWDLIDGI